MISTGLRPLLTGVAIFLVAAACGGDGGGERRAAGGEADRTVEIEMVDIAFKPNRLSVKAGETIRFVFPNRGEIEHEAVVGDEEAQAAHKEGVHGGGYGGSKQAPRVEVFPGETGELTHTFEKPGQVLIGCHEPGHYDAGMRVDITVSQEEPISP